MKDLGWITENPITGELINPIRRIIIKLKKYPKGKKSKGYINAEDLLRAANKLEEGWINQKDYLKALSPKELYIGGIGIPSSGVYFHKDKKEGNHAR